jgi:hypothetical protein
VRRALLRYLVEAVADVAIQALVEGLFGLFA